MKKAVFAGMLLVVFMLLGCAHPMRITNVDEYFAPPSAPLRQVLTLGVTSQNMANAQGNQYVTAIIDALQRSGNFARIVYPYNQANHLGAVDVVVDIAVNPRYSGSGSNFFVNWPGFLIFAPAIWGYKYHAEIETRAVVTHQPSGQPQDLSIPTRYVFRHAEMNRTWTEVGWLEVGIIPLIGGIVFTDYDTNVTPEFIAKVSPSYGAYVAKRIIDVL